MTIPSLWLIPWSMLIECGTRSVDLKPNSAEIGQTWPQLGRTRPNFGRFWTQLADVGGIRPNGTIGPDSTEFDRRRPVTAKFDRESIKFGGVRLGLARCRRPNSACKKLHNSRSGTPRSEVLGWIARIWCWIRPRKALIWAHGADLIEVLRGRGSTASVPVAAMFVHIRALQRRFQQRILGRSAP